MTKELCEADGCTEPAVLAMVDAMAPIVERREKPACDFHVRTWYTHGKGTLWWFPLGLDDEADCKSLTEQQVAETLEKSRED